MLTQTTLAPSTPEAQGIASPAILAFLDAVDTAEIELNSLILVRHGQTIAQGWWQPYAPELPHMLFSLTKSFTSTAIGLAVAEGRLKLSDPVVSFFPEVLPAHIDANLAAMNVHNLLTMNTGHHENTSQRLRAAPDGDWVKHFLSLPVEHEPGSYFVYNSGASYMLGAIVQKLTGQTILEYLTPRLLQPLGVEGATWQSCPRGINTGGFGFNLKSAAIANFGQLYLQKGRWQGQQLITPQWIAAASAPQTRNDLNGTQSNPDWTQGYGYQFWRGRHNSYRGDGAFGQFCILLPDQDAVIALTSATRDTQTLLDLVWTHLLAAMQDAPLPADRQGEAALAQRLHSLTLRPQAGAQSSPLASQLSGKPYRFEQNEEGIDVLQLDFDEGGATLTVQNAHGPQLIPCGYRSWRAGHSHFGQAPNELEMQRTAASGAWTADDTYTMRLCYNETPFIHTLTFHVGGDEQAGNRLEFNRRINLSLGPVEELQRPVWTGKAAGGSDEL